MTTLDGSNNNGGAMPGGGGRAGHNVDKGVCTNDVLEDLHRAIKFEAVFSTLIENKILSIKRECEEKRKQKRSLARFLFGAGRRRNVASIDGDLNIEAFPVDSSVGAAPITSTTTNGANGHWYRLEQENEKVPLNSADDPVRQGGGERDEFNGRMTETGMEGETASLNGKSIECSSLDRGPCHAVGGRQPRHPEYEYKYDAISIQSDTCKTGTSLCLSNDNMFTTKRQRLHTGRGLARASPGIGPQRDKRSQSDDFIARSNHSCPTQCRSAEFCCRRTVAVTRKFVGIEPCDNRVLAKPQQQPQQTHCSKSILSSSSSSILSNAVNDQSQTQSHGTKVGHHQHHNNNNNNSVSTNNNNNINSVSERGGPVKLNPREASILLEQERNRLRVFEMRSISAQCSPIMPRHIEFDNIVNLSNSAPIPLHPVPVYDEDPSHQHDSDAVRRTDSNRAPLDATPVKTHRRHHKSKSQRAAEYLASQIDFDSLTSYPLVNPKTQGIISSFNHLKSPNLPRVIPMKQPQTMNGCGSVCMTPPPPPPNTTATTTSAKVKKGDNSQVKTTTTATCGDNSMQQVPGSKSKNGGPPAGTDNNEPRQSIICDRNMESIGLHPTTSSTSGIRQCILSRPPNEPIEIEYCEDFLYETSTTNNVGTAGDEHRRHLVESGVRDGIGVGGNFEGGIESNHHRHHHRHRHHRHKHKHNQGEGAPKKKKKKKRKILVHDLDDQSIKVIDPDDMSQKARWTIIATACLLLVMCLALVGATLRMAPLIDDMGK